MMRVAMCAQPGVSALRSLLIPLPAPTTSARTCTLLHAAAPCCTRPQELTTDKVLAEAEIRKTLGTLRYLRSLQAQRKKASAAAAPEPRSAPGEPGAPGQAQPRQQQEGAQQAQGGPEKAAEEQAGAAGEEEEGAQEMCPICHDPIGASCAMLPCGHMVRLPGAPCKCMH